MALSWHFSVFLSIVSMQVAEGGAVDAYNKSGPKMGVVRDSSHESDFLKRSSCCQGLHFT